MIAVVLAAGMVLLGAVRRVDVYSAFSDGAQEGMRTALHVTPYLCAALLLIAFLRGSGVLAFAENLLAPLMEAVGLPRELLAFLLIRPVSGSGSLSALSALIDALGVDAPASRMAAVLMGSSETILYVLGLYLGAVKLRSSRFCVAVSLISAVFGAVFALFVNEIL